jgi:hypothetical protein
LVSVPLLQALEHHVEPLVEADATDIAQNTERRPGGGGRSHICARGTGLQHQDESSEFRVFAAKFGRFILSTGFIESGSVPDEIEIRCSRVPLQRLPERRGPVGDGVLRDELWPRVVPRRTMHRVREPPPPPRSRVPFTSTFDQFVHVVSVYFVHCWVVSAR